VEVSWPISRGDLDVQLVDAGGNAYRFKGPKERGLRKPGAVRFLGGGRDNYVRVVNAGADPIPYLLGLAQGGNIYLNW
jgi:hypothetical protein